MRTARQYVESMDYTKVVEAYQAAIELKPEEPEPYVELTEFYLEQEKYYEAGETAREGWNATGDQRLYNLIDQVTLSRTQAQATVQLQPYQETEDARQLQKLVLRADMVENVASTLLCMALGMVLISLMIPLVYKFGAEKARVLIILIGMSPALLIFLLAGDTGLEVSISERIIFLLFSCSPLIGLVFMIVSCLISIRIYQNKEF